MGGVMSMGWPSAFAIGCVAFAIAWTIRSIGR
jgi:hypothetical protein